MQAAVLKHCRASELTRHTGLAKELGAMSARLEAVARGVMEYLDGELRGGL